MLEKRPRLGDLGLRNRFYKPKIAVFPVKFPFSREFCVETGAISTASPASQCGRLVFGEFSFLDEKGRGSFMAAGIGVKSLMARDFRRRLLRRVVRADAVAAGDGDLRTVAYAQLAHDLSDMDLHGRFCHSKLAADDLVGMTLAKAGENRVLPLGKLRSRPNAVAAIADLDAGGLHIE